MMYMMDSCLSCSCDYFNSISVLKMHAKGKNKSSDEEFSLHMCIFLNFFFIIGMVLHTYILWTKWTLKQCFLFLTPLSCSNIPGNQVIFKPLLWFFLNSEEKFLKLILRWIWGSVCSVLPSIHFVALPFRRGFHILCFNQFQPFLNTKILWLQELMCIKSNLLKLTFFTPSNNNMKCTVNKSAAGKYSMFFIYSSQKWWGKCTGK